MKGVCVGYGEQPPPPRLDPPGGGGATHPPCRAPTSIGLLLLIIYSRAWS